MTSSSHAEEITCLSLASLLYYTWIAMGAPLGDFSLSMTSLLLMSFFEFRRIVFVLMFVLSYLVINDEGI